MTLEEQVGQLTGRVYQLEQEVEKLKSLSRGAAPEIKSEPIIESVPEPIVEIKAESIEERVAEETVTETMEMEAPQPQIQPQIQPQVQHRSIYPQVNMGKHAPKEKSNMEKTFGIKVMAVLASVLVFVSLILFGSYVFEYLPTVGKIGIMALVSAAFAAVGLINMKKKSKLKVLFGSMAGCGVGGLYITIIVAAFLIETIHLPVMLILLAVWTLFVMLLSRFMSKIFLYICYAGVAVTTVYFGYFGDGSLVAIIYYFVSTVLLFTINYTGSFAADSFFFLQLPIAAFALAWFYEQTMWVLIAIIALLAVVMIAQLFAYKLNRRDVPFLIIYDILSYLGMLLVSAALIDNFRELTYLYEVLAAVFIIIAIAYGIKYFNKHAVLYYPVFYATAVVLVTFPYSIFVERYIGCSLFMIALLVAGVLKDNKHFKYTGYAYFILYALHNNDGNGWMPLIAILVMSASIALIFVHNRLKYSMGDKFAVLAGLLMLVEVMGSCQLLNHTTVFMLLAIISIVINKKWFEINPVTGEKEKASAVIAYVMNASMMLYGSLLLINCEHNMKIVKVLEQSSLLMIMIVALLTIALFAMNTVELFNLDIQEGLVGVYISVKFTWLVYAILERLSAVGYVESLVGLALAIAFIVAGFMVKKKSFRFYGLALTIICVIKLVLVDIEYNYDIMKPLSYLFAGVICFAISWFYSKIEKKESSEE